MTGSRVSYAVEQIRELISRNESGAKLGSKAQLAARLGISAGTINQAARLLQSEGRIVARTGPGGGLFVSDQTPLEQLASTVVNMANSNSLYHDAIRVRRALDPVLIQDVIRKKTPRHKHRIKSLIKSLHQAADAGDLVAFCETSWSYQLAIYAASDHEFSYTILNTAIRIQRDMNPVMYADSANLHELCRHHESLWEAIEADDYDTAVNIVAEAITLMT